MNSTKLLELIAKLSASSTNSVSPLPRKASFASYRKVVGVFIGTIVMIVVGLFVPLSFDARWTFAIILFGIITGYIFHVLPNWFTSLFIVMVIPTGLGFVPISVSFSAVTSSIFWAIVMGIIVGIAFDVSGLGKRIAYAMVRRFARGWTSMVVVVYALELIFALTVPYSPVASIIIVVTLSIEVLKAMKYDLRGKAATGLVIGAALATNSWEFAFFTGWPLNPLLLHGIISAGAVTGISWVEWFVYIGPPAFFFTILCMFINIVVFRPEKTFKIDKHFFAMKSKELGSITRKETLTLAITMTILLEFLLNVFLKNYDPYLVSLGLCAIFFVPALGFLKTDDFIRRMQWPFVSFILGLFSLGNIFLYLGIGNWLANLAMPPSISTWSPFLINEYVYALVTGLNFIVGSVTPLIAVFVPSFSAYAVSHGMATIPVAFSVAWAAKRWIFPYQEAMVAFSTGFGIGDTREYVKMGVLVTLLLLLIVPLSTIWWMAIGLYSP